MDILSVVNDPVLKEKTQAWEALGTSEERLKLLQDLGVEEHPFVQTEGISIEEVSKQGDYRLLPLMVRFAMASAFDGGRFSKETQEQELHRFTARVTEVVRTCA